MIQTVFIWVCLASPLAALALFTNSLSVVAVASLALPFLGFVVFAMLRWLLRAPGGSTARSEWSELDPYEAAFLVGGHRLAVDAAITSLVQRKVLAVDASERTLQIRESQPTPAHPLEQAVHSAIDSESGRSIEEVRATVATAVGGVRARLQSLGLVISERRAETLQFAAYLVTLSNLLTMHVYFYLFCMAMRDVKLLDAVAPAALAGGWLIGAVGQFMQCMLCMVGLAVVLLPCILMSTLMDGPPDRSRAGDTAIATLKQRNGALALRVPHDTEELEGDDLIVAMALFDRAGPAEGPLAELREALEDPADGDCDADGDGDGCDGFDAGGD